MTDGQSGQDDRHIDELALRFGRLARALQRRHDPHGTLEEIVASAVALIPGAEEGSISVVVGRRQVRPEAPSGQLAARVDQLQGERAGLINPEFDNAFLDKLVDKTDALRAITRLEYIREAGTEGIELIMWLIMRAALGDKVEPLHRFYHVPASNTAVGHIVLRPVN